MEVLRQAYSCTIGKIPGPKAIYEKARHLRPPSLREVFHFLFKSFLTLLCVGFMHYQTMESVDTFLEYPYEVVLFDLRIPDQILFPAVTMCTDIWFDKMAPLCHENPKICTTKGQMVTIGSYAFQSNATLRQLTRLKASDLFNCTMTSSMCPSFDCAEFMQPTYFRQPRLQCYTLDLELNLPRLHGFWKCKQKWSYKLQISTEWDYDRVEPFVAYRMDAMVYVQGPGIAMPEPQTIAQIPLGKNIKVGIKQLITERLGHPFPSNCQLYTKQDAMYFGTETREFYIQQCLIDVELELCGCVMNFHEYAEHRVGSGTAAYCSLFQVNRCFTVLVEADAYSKCIAQCQVGCRDITYDVKVLSIGDVERPGENGTMALVEETYKLDLQFYSDRIEMSIEQEKLSAIELYGYVGGYVGIWVGLSLLDGLSMINDKLLIKF